MPGPAASGCWTSWLGAWCSGIPAGRPLAVHLLASTLAREGAYTMGGAVWTRMTRLMIASALMGAFAGVCAWQYETLAQVLWRKEVAVLAVIVVGVLIYGVAAFALARHLVWSTFVTSAVVQPCGSRAPGGSFYAHAPCRLQHCVGHQSTLGVDDVLPRHPPSPQSCMPQGRPPYNPSF